MKHNVISIFGCGGAGINLITPFLKHHGKKEPGFAEMKPIFLDTSDSNMRKGVPEEQVYLIDGLDGSGKKRDSNYQAISEKAKDILHRFKPTDINVVVHSASGGSGSVIGPVLVSELLARGESVVVLMVGSTDSRIEAKNTANTLKSYEVIAEKRQMPVVAVYYENTKAEPRGKIDVKVHTSLVMLTAIFSGENRELDSADLKNFLNYPRVTSFSPKLSYLDFFSKSVEVAKNQSVTSLVTLTDDATDSSPDMHVEYQAVGFVEDNVKEAISVELPIHAAIVSGYYHDKLEALENLIKDIDEARATVVEKSIVTKGHVATDDGLVM